MPVQLDERRSEIGDLGGPGVRAVDAMHGMIVGNVDAADLPELLEVGRLRIARVLGAEAGEATLPVLRGIVIAALGVGREIEERACRLVCAPRELVGNA